MLTVKVLQKKLIITLEEIILESFQLAPLQKLFLFIALWYSAKVQTTDRGMVLFVKSVTGALN